MLSGLLVFFMLLRFNQWRRWDLNPRPPVCQTGALPLRHAPLGTHYSIHEIRN